MSSKTTMKKILSVLFALILVVGLVAATPAVGSASVAYNEAVADDANGILQVRYEIWGTGTATFVLDDGSRVTRTYDNEMIYGCSGSCFLINDYTALTCAHVVNHDKLFQTLKKMNLKPEIKMYVLLANNVPMEYTVPHMSVDDDFAIITLKQSIGAKKILELGFSDRVKTTQKVYSLGFPGVVSSVEEEANEYNIKYYTEDVTITEGAIQKVNNINNTDVIQHGSSIAGGNSGGPLVDAEGYVIGLNKWNTTSKEDYYWATGINQIITTLDNLKIPYTRQNDVVTPTVADKTDASVDNEPTTEAATVAPVTPTVNDSNTTGKSDEGGNSKMIIIIAIIALVVILAVVLIVVIMASSKKKKNSNNTLPPMPPAPPTGTGTGMTPPQPPVASMPPRPYTPPVAPQNNYNNMNEGAGETSVLSEGAGETTVLGQGSVGVALVRKSTGEKININKPDFTIGKERRRVDYCISNNSSISRAHARLTVRAGRCYICDLGSTNCTFVNGTKLSPNQEVVLSKGDKIKLADEEFVFEG